MAPLSSQLAAARGSRPPNNGILSYERAPLTAGSPDKLRRAQRRGTFREKLFRLERAIGDVKASRERPVDGFFKFHPEPATAANFYSKIFGGQIGVRFYPSVCSFFFSSILVSHTSDSVRECDVCKTVLEFFPVESPS